MISNSMPPPKQSTKEELAAQGLMRVPWSRYPVRIANQPRKSA